MFWLYGCSYVQLSGFEVKNAHGRDASAILLEPGTPLSYLLQEKRIAVNSTHHQGIKRLSPILKCMARAFDGLTEAAYLPLKKFIWGVQWHPELPDLYCNDLNEKIFETFVTYARLGRNKY